MATPEVVALCGVPASTLASWVARGLCQPSLAASGGRRRATQYWSVRDVVMVRAIRTLREAGCPLAVLEKASEVLRGDWDSDLANAVLWWDGADIVTVTLAGEVVSLVTRHGQGIFAEVAVVQVSCPIAAWSQQVNGLLRSRPLIPVADIQQRREAAAVARATAKASPGGTGSLSAAIQPNETILAHEQGAVSNESVTADR